jgi:hypothetical protein
MTIECYYTQCRFHGVHAAPDEGPFCYKSECEQDSTTLALFGMQRAGAALQDAERRVSSLRNALRDLVDGQSAEDIHRFTGLPMLRCEQILTLAQGDE